MTDDALLRAVRLDCQPKSQEDAVLVSGAWRARILALAAAEPVGVGQVDPKTSLLDGSYYGEPNFPDAPTNEPDPGGLV